MPITKQEAIDACYDKAVVHDEDELGKLLSFLNRLPDVKLAILRPKSSNKTIVSFLRTEMAAATVAQPPAAPPGATSVQAGGQAATGSINLNELLKPDEEVYVLEFKVCNTPRRTRLTLKVIMEQNGIRGHIRRVSPTQVSATAIVGTGEQNERALVQFTRSLRAFVNITDTDIKGSPYILKPSWQRVILKQRPKIAEMYLAGVQVDKVSQATKRSYTDPSGASSDSDGVVSTTSSLPNADRSIDIPS